MLNTLVIEGRLVADPEERRTQSGKLTVSGRIACQRSYKNKEGSYDTDFFNFVIFGDGGVSFRQTFRKGNKVVVNGRIEMRSYKNKEGNAVWYPEIVVSNWVFPETKKENQIRTNAELDDRLEAQMQELDDDGGDLPF